MSQWTVFILANPIYYLIINIYNHSNLTQIKSNAYGHWIDQILQIYKWLPIKYIVVDSFPEYNIVMRHSKFNVLLLGETLAVNYEKFNFKRTTFCVYNLETLQVLAKLNKKLKIHLFLNTGMNREWIDASWCFQNDVSTSFRLWT